MAVSLVQAHALEQRRALRRATGPSSIKGSLCKSGSSPRSNSPTLPRLPGQVELPPPSPRAQAHVRPTSLPPVWGQPSPHSPRAERIRGARNLAAPRVSDGIGVGSGGGAFCHFPALAPARPEEAAGGAHARSSSDEGRAADVYVDAAASDAGDAGDAKGHCAEVGAWQPAPPSLSRRGASMGRLRGGRGRGQVEEVEEAPEALDPALDPAIETMLEDFGRLVKRFEREHGVEEDEEDHVSKRPQHASRSPLHTSSLGCPRTWKVRAKMACPRHAAHALHLGRAAVPQPTDVAFPCPQLEAMLSPVERLELERDNLLGGLAMEAADVKQTADEKLQAEQKASAPARVPPRPVCGCAPSPLRCALLPRA